MGIGTFFSVGTSLKSGTIPSSTKPLTILGPRELQAHDSPRHLEQLLPGRGEMCWKILTFGFRQSPMGRRGELERTWEHLCHSPLWEWGCGLAKRQRGLGACLYWGTLGKKLHPLSFSVLICRLGIHSISFLRDCMGINRDDKARDLLSPGHSKTNAGC